MDNFDKEERKEILKQLNHEVEMARVEMLFSQGFSIEDIEMMSGLSYSEILRIVKEHEEESK